MFITCARINRIQPLSLLLQERLKNETPAPLRILFDKLGSHTRLTDTGVDLFKALQSEDKIGTMLPCNVIFQEFEEGKVDVSAVDPLASMQAVQNTALEEIAHVVRVKLKRVIASL